MRGLSAVYAKKKEGNRRARVHGHGHPTRGDRASIVCDSPLSCRILHGVHLMYVEGRIATRS
jgi:hypothetical protein